jgi:triosephosphate isomerase
MNHGPAAAKAFFDTLAKQDLSSVRPALEKGRLRAMLYVPYVTLHAALKDAGEVEIGAQNVHFKDSGAFTGEISAPLLKEIGITRALVGHSERRQYFGETDSTAAQRTAAALAAGLDVTLCVGETRAEREAGKTSEVLLRQLSGGLPAGDAGARDAAGKALAEGRLRIAYEPVWAIGTGLTATAAQAQEAHALIRADLAKRLGKDAGTLGAILYGGSVTPENVGELLACPDVDGGLVGGASLKATDYAALLRAGAAKGKS